MDMIYKRITLCIVLGLGQVAGAAEKKSPLPLMLDQLCIKGVEDRAAMINPETFSPSSGTRPLFFCLWGGHNPTQPLPSIRIPKSRIPARYQKAVKQEEIEQPVKEEPIEESKSPLLVIERGFKPITRLRTGVRKARDYKEESCFVKLKYEEDDDYTGETTESDDTASSCEEIESDLEDDIEVRIKRAKAGKAIVKGRPNKKTTEKSSYSEGEFPCRECKKCFTRASNLTRHMRIHTGEKRFECDDCDKRFAEKHHLTAHIRTHTGEKPFGCDSCNKRFTDKSNMLRHRLIHDKE